MKRLDPVQNEKLKRKKKTILGGNFDFDSVYSSALREKRKIEAWKLLIHKNGA